MSGYSNTPAKDPETYWSNDVQFEMNGADFSTQQPLDFQTFDQNQIQNTNWSSSNQYAHNIMTLSNTALDPNSSRASFMDEAPAYYGENMYAASPSVTQANMSFTNFATDSVEEDEPPLLEELGIDPERIMEKTLTALNPFRSRGPTDDINFLLRDSDLAGPLVFCLALGACLLVGGKIHFGYIYGLAVTCCLMMYTLLTLMTTTEPSVTLMSVASVLGYCILPVVGLSALGVFFTLQSPIGMALTFVAVAWCTLSSSRLFVTMLTENNMRPLIAYPCALLYATFALIAIF